MENDRDLVILFQDGEVTSCDVTTIKSLQTVDENSVAVPVLKQQG